MRILQQQTLLTLALSLSWYAELPIARAAAVRDESDNRASMRLVTVDSNVPVIELLALDDSTLTVRTDKSATLQVSIDDCVALELETRPQPQAGWTLRLAGGDVLRGWPAAFDDELIMFDTRAFGTVTVPLEQVLTYESHEAPESAWRDRLAEIRSQERAEDVILLSNGDTTSGFVESLSRDGLVVDVEGTLQRLPFERVVGICFVPPAPLEPPRRHLVIEDCRGSRLTLSELRIEGSELAGRTLFDSTVSPRCASLRSIRFEGGRWDWLVDHEPVEVVASSMTGLAWPMRRNLSVVGSPLEVGYTRFDRGIGVHAQSSLVYDLGGKYREFVTEFGIDQSGGDYSDVDIRILVDGREAYARRGVRYGSLLGPVRVPLIAEGRPASRLTLQVGFGRFGDIQDRFDWIRPALIQLESDAAPDARDP